MHSFKSSATNIDIGSEQAVPNSADVLAACLSLVDAPSLIELEHRFNHWLARLYAPISWTVVCYFKGDNEAIFLMERKAEDTLVQTSGEVQRVCLPLWMESNIQGQLHVDFVAKQGNLVYDQDILSKLAQTLANKLDDVYSKLQALAQTAELLFIRRLLHRGATYDINNNLDKLAASLLRHLNVSSIQILMDQASPGGVSWGISSRRGSPVLSIEECQTLFRLVQSLFREPRERSQPYFLAYGVDLQNLVNAHELPSFRRLQWLLMVPIWNNDTLPGLVIVGEERSWGRQPLSRQTVCISTLLARLIADLVTETRLVEQLIARDRTKQALVDALDEAVVITKNGVIISWNRGAYQLLGYSHEEILGQLIADILPSAPPDLFDDDMVPKLLNGWKPSFEWEMQTTGGHPIQLSCTVTILQELKLDTPMIMYLLKEISQERELEFLKNELLSSVSHELRTPLNGIYGFGRLLMERPHLSDAMRREALESLQSSIQRLTRMADDFIDVARARRHRIPLELTEIDVEPVLRSAVRELKHHHYGHTITLRIQKNLPVVRGDNLRIRQIVDNLVSNAAKYAPAGTRIGVSVRQRGNVVAISVSDQGPGISKLVQARIFEPFYRADTAYSQGIGGVGLGLSIVKSLVQAHGGEVTIRSKLGQGSTFTFTLPVIGG